LESESLFELITTRSSIKFISIHLTIGSVAVEFSIGKLSGSIGFLITTELTQAEIEYAQYKILEAMFLQICCKQ